LHGTTERDAVFVHSEQWYTDQNIELRLRERVSSIARDEHRKREFIAFWMSGGRVLAGMNVNVWDVTDQIKVLIRERGTLDPDRLADPAIPLAEV
jgi:hypothetical protein